MCESEREREYVCVREKECACEKKSVLPLSNSSSQECPVVVVMISLKCFSLLHACSHKEGQAPSCGEDE